MLILLEGVGDFRALSGVVGVFVWDPGSTHQKNRARISKLVSKSGSIPDQNSRIHNPGPVSMYTAGPSLGFYQSDRSGPIRHIPKYCLRYTHTM